MKVLIVYMSFHHWNTKKILDVMAKELKKKHIVKMLKVSKADESLIKKSDLVIFGSGIYFSKHHRLLLDFVDKLPSLKKKTVIVSTSGFKFWGKLFHKPLRKKLMKKGFEVVAEFNCPGLDTYYKVFRLVGGLNKGRPGEKDFEKARKFVNKIIL